MARILDLLRPPPPLPEDFLFGVATADHQSEAYDPDREDIWDVWERRRGLTPRGRATDFWDRYPEDVGHARRLGCGAFRFSISWARVEPAPGQFDDAAFEHYRQVADTIRSAGMQPILTLLHFTWPVHVQEHGGLAAPEFPDRFAHYAAEVAERLGEHVRYWITFNEPTQLVYGYLKPWWVRDYFFPPGLPEGVTWPEEIGKVGDLIRNLFLAHAAARQVIKRRYPDALVGANPLLLGLPAWLQRLVDWNAARLYHPEDLSSQAKRFAERPLIERGEVDAVVATLTVTPDRSRTVMFSEVYYVAGQVLLVHADSPVDAMQDLAGQSVAVIKGSTAEHDLRTLVPGARRRVVEHCAQGVEALERGKVAAFLADDVELRPLLVEHPHRFRLLGERLVEEPYAAAVAPGDPLLFDAVDAAVRRFKQSGAWADSYAQHLGAPLQEPRPATDHDLSDLGDEPLARAAAERVARDDLPLPLAPSGTALRRIQDRGHLVVGVNEDVPGFGWRDPSTGVLSGLEIDLARQMAAVIFGDPQKVRFRPVATKERLSLLRSILRFLDPLLRHFSILSTVFTSNWWHMGMAGKLPAFLCPPECIGQQDFVGLDYYWGINTFQLDRIRALLEAAAGRYERAPVWPGTLHSLLKYHTRLSPGLPILIAENGCVDSADGVTRVEYLRRHVYQLQRALRDGVPVAGYVCWSITSNREWGHPFGPGSDFGLYHIELDTDPTLTRRPTPAAQTFQEIMARRGA